MIARKIEEFLQEKGIEYTIMEHPQAYTAQEIAAVTHIKGKALAKAVVIKADNELMMAVLPADHKVSLPKLEKLLHAHHVELAAEENFKDRFPGCETGAQPPLGILYNMKVIADDSLKDADEMSFNAGTHKDIITMHRKDWEKIVQPVQGSFSVHI